MLKSLTAWTRSRGGSRAPAIALIETLVACALLASAVLGFLAVMREARTDLARTRERADASVLAMEILTQARSTWRSGPYGGERAEFSWRLSCAAPPGQTSARLLIATCAVTISRRGVRIVEMETSWAEPAAHALRR